MTVDLRHLRSFVAKIAGAATRLFITQPALSRQIQELEREIGERFFLRVPAGVEVTEAARAVLPKAWSRLRPPRTPSSSVMRSILAVLPASGPRELLRDAPEIDSRPRAIARRRLRTM